MSGTAAPKPPEICPTPKNKRYATFVAAAACALRDAFVFGASCEPYPCSCGWWHVGTLAKGHGKVARLTGGQGRRTA